MWYSVGDINEPITLGGGKYVCWAFAFKLKGWFYSEKYPMQNTI